MFGGMEIMKDDLCSVLVNSCDKYEDAWYPFFELLKKYWYDCPFKFYLNTESKNYEHKGIDLTVINGCHCSIITEKWGERLKKCLKKIDSPYVILLLDDFFMQKEVLEDELESCITMMENDYEIIVIYFKNIHIGKTNYESNGKYNIINENRKYKLNLQAGLWRKADLETLISDDDSPWSFEENGHFRISSPSKKFLCSRAGSHTNIKNCVFPYLTARNLGFGIWNGKWLWNNEKLFRKNGIKVDDIKMERFSKIDLFCHYFFRLKEKTIAPFKIFIK